jgi:hypothetical protein
MVRIDLPGCEPGSSLKTARYGGVTAGWRFADLFVTTRRAVPLPNHELPGRRERGSVPTRVSGAANRDELQVIENRTGLVPPAARAPGRARIDPPEPLLFRRAV